MADDLEQSRIRNRIALTALVLTTLGVVGGGATGLVGGGFFFATITGQIKKVGDDVGEIKNEIKILGRDMEKKIQAVDRDVRELDIRVNRLEVRRGLEEPGD